MVTFAVELNVTEHDNEDVHLLQWYEHRSVCWMWKVRLVAVLEFECMLE